MQENPPPGTAQVLSPSNQTTTTQLSQQPYASESHTMNYAVNVSESTGIEEAVTVSVEVSTDVDPFDRFLPPPPMARCSDELQEKINKFLYLKRLGKSYNAEVRKKKEYRNPDFLLHAVTYQDIDEIGSCFSKDVFDPHGYDKSDYYAEIALRILKLKQVSLPCLSTLRVSCMNFLIEADMKRELDRKEQEKKKSQKVEFVTGGTQPVVVTPTPKINIPIPGVSTVATGGLHPVDSGARDRQNKKSKWDKVDGDRRNPLHSGGQDSVSTASAHATLLTAANAGTGYTAFA
ncbi:transcriptional regulator family protein [Actinidia rufa]|uniref:Transcriptional regulator family protein n=1 Tax=Actinidia rufa TaxID=165716 RepID=A0A7J0ER33_9ERIC|nr:transcriptional regulator family protein [Actinidia rufa]